MPIRSQMYQGQTPQSFRIGLFESVYCDTEEKEQNLVTDACKLFFLKGYKVHMVEGETSNFKITYPFDLEMARMMIGEQKNDQHAV